ncbi:MAG: hypothetical protein M3350_00485 [Actinomycetota bacterium]|nr:hypothetical protein [Actinomycetota bacterium]
MRKALTVIVAVAVVGAVGAIVYTVVAGGSEDAQLAGAKDCPVFPKSSHWNRPVDELPLHSRSAQIVSSIGRDRDTHADFGSGLYEGAPIGIPFRTVSSRTKTVPVSFEYADDSDRGPYPIPRNAPIEGGPNGDGDRHVIVVDGSRCRLYELFDAHPGDGGKSWRAGSGAIWDLRSNRLRRRGYTSADAAGLPILPGLARPEEVGRGKIAHALRITVPRSRSAFIYPALHFASEDPDPNLPAMGQRLRLKRSFDTSRFPRQSRVVLNALKRYGAIVADNGSPWYISGVPSPRWNNGDLSSLQRVPGSAWEVVDSTRLSRPR